MHISFFVVFEFNAVRTFSVTNTSGGGAADLSSDTAMQEAATVVAHVNCSLHQLNRGAVVTV